jgi:hypothetical protein
VDQMLLVRELKLDVDALLLGRLTPLLVGVRLENPLTDEEMLVLADKVRPGVDVLEVSFDGAVDVGLLLLPTEVVPVM